MPLNPMQGWLRAQQLTKVYRTRNEEVEVFKDLNFEVARGELVAIVGESGAGEINVAAPAWRARSAYIRERVFG